jgi:tetratricopeptide (TPR) repeat protein
MNQSSGMADFWIGSIGHRSPSGDVVNIPHIAALQYGVGLMAMQVGIYDVTKDSFELALTNARINKHQETISILLNALGDVQEKLGSSEDAENALNEGLSIARHIHDRFRICSLSATLGGIKNNRCNYKQAKTHFLEGLSIARELNDADLISSLLSNIGLTEIGQAQYPRAKKYFQEGLTFARKVKNRNRICLLHLHLGIVENLLAHPRQAKKYFAEALLIANKIGNQVKIDAVLNSQASLVATSKKEIALQLAQDNRNIFEPITHTITPTLRALLKDFLHYNID